MVRMDDYRVEVHLDAYLLEQASKLIPSVLIFWYNNISNAICKHASSWNGWRVLGGFGARFGVKWKVSAMWLIGNHTYFHAIKE